MTSIDNKTVSLLNDVLSQLLENKGHLENRMKHDRANLADIQQKEQDLRSAIERVSSGQNIVIEKG